jgi:hypothetical protein
MSTYALECLIVYIFNVFHQELMTPLQVFVKFLSVFSVFQWETDALTVWVKLLLFIIVF